MTVNKIGLIGLILVIVATLANLYWSSSRVKQEANRSKQEVWIDSMGRLHTMGLTLDQTTLREAEIALKSRSDPALYLYPDSKNNQDYTLSLEAFFPSIADHSMLVLGCYASRDLLLQIESRASMPHLNQNGVARMNIAVADLNLIQNLRVIWLRYIPSVQIEIEHIQARFGQAQSMINTQQNTGDLAATKLLLYPNIGLHVLIRGDGKDELIFTQLSVFKETTDKILAREKLSIL